MALVPATIVEGRRILLFSQYVSMLELTAAALAARKKRTPMLSGRTPRRDRVIAGGHRGEAQVYLISLRAGAPGSNLTEAATFFSTAP